MTIWQSPSGCLLLRLHAGGPGLTDPPDILALYAVQPSRRIRGTLND
ncbi:hypothetical protein AB0H18_26725 [Streptomyces sp. NPDC020766]